LLHAVFRRELYVFTWAILILTGLYRLLFMTYNGAVMLAVAVGAFLGYLAFGGSTAAKSVACH